MIFKNAIESLEETPLVCQKTFTEISELKQQSLEHAKIINDISQYLEINEENVNINNIKEINHAFLKLNDAEQKILNKYNHLIEFIDDQVSTFETELEEYKEGCAISALKLRANGLDKIFESVELPEKYCFCKSECQGNMVACDNENCAIEWFHYDCVGLKEPPKGKWICDDCKNNNKF